MKRNPIRYKNICVTFASAAKVDLISSRDIFFHKSGQWVVPCFFSWSTWDTTEDAGPTNPSWHCCSKYHFLFEGPTEVLLMKWNVYLSLQISVQWQKSRLAPYGDPKWVPPSFFMYAGENCETNRQAMKKWPNRKKWCSNPLSYRRFA